MMEIGVRSINPSEVPLLDDFLYEAIFLPPGVEAPPRSIIDDPALQVYVEGFGTRLDDHGLVAEVDGKVVGAVWVRVMNDYGHLDDDTPSLAISLYPAYRKKGIGTLMMRRMLYLLREKGYQKVSLSVQKENARAVHLYQKTGFETIRETPDEFLMVCRLCEIFPFHDY